MRRGEARRGEVENRNYGRANGDVCCAALRCALVCECLADGGKGKGKGIGIGIGIGILGGKKASSRVRVDTVPSHRNACDTKKQKVAHRISYILVRTRTLFSIILSTRF